ncbi:MAG: hypothetical protein IJF46_08855 [Bacteroidaceae bacterium]|nr:hypothetical protein [Bacteroidaceae bacterium]
MKTKSLYLLLAALFSALLSCSDDSNEPYIADVAPYSINILVRDAEGNDLLVQDKAEEIKFEYSGEIYGINATIGASRAQPVCFHGLLRLATDDGRHFLSFGEFQGDKNVSDELVIIHWGDGTSDNISFSNHCDIKEGRINIERTIKLNGEIVESTHSLAPHNGKAFIIVKSDTKN